MGLKTDCHNIACRSSSEEPGAHDDGPSSSNSTPDKSHSKPSTSGESPDKKRKHEPPSEEELKEQQRKREKQEEERIKMQYVQFLGGTKECTSKEDSLRSVRKSSQTWQNAISLRPCYRPSRIVTSFYRGKEAAS
jgi:hypothetical protein